MADGALARRALRDEDARPNPKSATTRRDANARAKAKISARARTRRDDARVEGFEKNAVVYSDANG